MSAKKSGLSSPPPFGARLQLARRNQQVWPACADSPRAEARRRRQARSAHAIEAERGARRPRWRPPEAARDLRPHGVLRRRLQRTLGFAEAVLLRRVSPSPLRPHPFDRAKPNRFRSQRNRLLSSPSASVDVGPRPLACHTPAPLPTCLSPPHPRSFSRRRLGRRFSCPGARCLRCLTGLHRACTQLSISAPLLTTAGALAARCVQLQEAVEVRRHPRWRQAAESSGVCMRAAGATCEPGSGRLGRAGPACSLAGGRQKRGGLCLSACLAIARCVVPASPPGTRAVEIGHGESSQSLCRCERCAE